MDKNEASKGGRFRDGVGAPMEQFNRNEATSAAAGDGFPVEEDDDYEDLLNNVNLGENFLGSFRKNEEVDKAVGASVQAAIGKVKVEKEENVMSRVMSAVDRFGDLTVWGNEMGDRDLVPAARSETFVAGGVKVESRRHPSGKMVDSEKHASKNVANGEIIQRPTAASSGGLGNAGNVGNSRNDNMVSGNAMDNLGSFGVLGAGPSREGGGGGTILFVGDLHWCTADAELEAESRKYGAVKEVTFFSERRNGKSKGYCQVEFYEPAAAAACKEGMNGHVFNGQPCQVAFASPFTVKKMGEALRNLNRLLNAQSQTDAVDVQVRRGAGYSRKPGGNKNNATVDNFQGGRDSNRDLGRGNRCREGPVSPMRSWHGGDVGRRFMGNAGDGFGQVIGAASPLIHPQTMMGQCFDPAFGGPMGRMDGYGGFHSGPTPPFSSILPSSPPVGGVGLPGVAPHVNPAYFGRGMPPSGMGIMPRAGLEGPNMGMWSDPPIGLPVVVPHVNPAYFGRGMPMSGMGIMPRADFEGPNMVMWFDPNVDGWAGDEHGSRGESNYAAGSDHDWQDRRREGDRNVGRERERDSPRSSAHDLERHRGSEPQA